MSDGPIPAVVTPFRPNELIDFTAWQTILEVLVSSGVSGVLVAGREGEVDSLSEEERVVAMRFCRQTLAHRANLFANIGSGSTRESVRLAHAAESEGVDGVVVLLPERPGISDEEIAEHFSEICRAVQIPVYGYERLPAAAVIRLQSTHENFAGMLNHRKAAVSNLVRRGTPESLVEPLERTLRLHCYPAMLKEALNLIGFQAGRCRRPVAPVPDSSREILFEAIHSLRGHLLQPATKARAGSAA